MFFKKKKDEKPDMERTPIKPDIPEEAKNYVNDEYKLSIVIPAGMRLYTLENPGPMKNRLSSETPLILVNPQFPEENINVKVSENISEKDISEFKSMLDNEPNTPLPRYRRVSVGFCQIGKHNDKAAVEHVFYMKGNIYGKMRQISFQHNGRGFTWTCGTAEERYDLANQQFFDAIFRSLECIPLVDPALLNMVPLDRWTTPTPEEAQERMLKKLQSITDKNCIIGPHMNPENKTGFSFMGSGFIESIDVLPQAFEQMAEHVKDKNYIFKELKKYVEEGASYSNITHISEIKNDPEHLVLVSESTAYVVVNRTCFDYLFSSRRSSQLLMVFPSRVIGFIGADHNDGVIIDVRK